VTIPPIDLDAIEKSRAADDRKNALDLIKKYSDNRE